MKVRSYCAQDEGAVIALWKQCDLLRPWNDPVRDIERKMGEQPELFLVGELDGAVMATAMAGFDGHRAWVYYLAVAPSHRQRSYGRALMERIEERLRERGCPKVNLLVRSSNRQVLDFYHRLGYRQDDVVCLGRRLIPD